MQPPIRELSSLVLIAERIRRHRVQYMAAFGLMISTGEAVSLSYITSCSDSSNLRYAMVMASASKGVNL